MQEEQISQAGHIVRLVIDDSKEEYNVFIMDDPRRVHLGFDNAKDARKLYDVLQNLDGMNAQCRFCEQEIQEEKQQLSLIAQSILTVITESTKPPRGSYIAGWHICDQLGVARTELDCSFTKYDFALKELIDLGLVEELPDLGCRYRLKKG